MAMSFMGNLAFTIEVNCFSRKYLALCAKRRHVKPLLSNLMESIAHSTAMIILNNSDEMAFFN